MFLEHISRKWKNAHEIQMWPIVTREREKKAGQARLQSYYSNPIHSCSDRTPEFKSYYSSLAKTFCSPNDKYIEILQFPKNNRLVIHVCMKKMYWLINSFMILIFVRCIQCGQYFFCGNRGQLSRTRPPSNLFTTFKFHQWYASN